MINWRLQTVFYVFTKNLVTIQHQLIAVKVSCGSNTTSRPKASNRNEGVAPTR